MNPGVIVRAKVAAMLSASDGFNPLPWGRATAIVCNAIEAAASVPGGMAGTDEEATHRLTLAGVIALYQVRAGMVERETLINRINSLPKDQARAYSLRIEHGLSDWQIAEFLGITEDAVVALILRALMALTGVSDDTGKV
jgi:DNA-directed RNA polymerase specialized sigma24 family protein